MLSDTTIYILAAVPVVGALLWIVLVIHSLLLPSLRVWPVPLPDDRAAFLRALLNRSTGPIVGISAACLLALALLDFGSLQLPRWLHLGFGALLFLAGGAFAASGFRTLGPEISTGTPPGELELRGPYRISRNPQYVGTIGALLGTGLLANSSLCILAGLGWCVWFLVAPFAEEAWLRGHLGPAYESYLSSTRRYL